VTHCAQVVIVVIRLAPDVQTSVPHGVPLVAVKVDHTVVEVDGDIEYPAVVSPDERPQLLARVELVLGL
jgi:hypothetical protein